MNIRQNEIDSWLMHNLARTTLILLIIIVYSIGRIISEGSSMEPLELIVFSIISIIGQFMFSVFMTIDGKSYLHGLAGLLALVSWAFAVFLFFYEGLWPLRTLLADFSITTIIKSLIWLLLSWKLLSYYHINSEVATKIGKEITIKD